MTRRNELDRRSFLRNGGIALGAGVTMAGPFQALTARGAAAQSPQRGGKGNGNGRTFSPDYGPLYPTKDQTTGEELIALPRGFEYITYGRTGDIMTDGKPTPSAHDGMGSFRFGDRVQLVRNHEQGNNAPAFTDPAYDPNANGGTTNLTFDPDAGQWISSYASLSGTIRNCAGGITPWGSWLTCEETGVGPGFGNTFQEPHGFVFEVPADGMGNPVPLKDMGRFSHEAAAVDPASGIVYETEDSGDDSGFYRFIPNKPGDLAAGGELQMLKIGETTVNTKPAGTGETWTEVSWVPIADPTTADTGLSTAAQGIAQGAAMFSRLEGIWYGAGKIYFDSTSGGPVGKGQIFEYDPVAETLTVIYASTSAATLESPDNLCFSPRGGIMLCEDGSGTDFLRGLTVDGQIFDFAKNLTSGGEWAGATFEPKNGNWLFVNIQSPGITFAITGPWRQGAL